MKIIVVASLAWSLVNFRGALLKALADAGADVVACAPEDDPAVTAALAALGVRYQRVAMQRAARNPFADLGTLRDLAALFRAERPDIVIAYTQKPIIYGGIAARLGAPRGLAAPTRFYAMCSGLGHVFTDVESARQRALRSLVSRLYRLAVARAVAVIVFNGDDRAEMLAHGILAPGQRVVQVPGSGIDTARFSAQPVPAGPPVFLMIARLLRDKGLSEFAAAARTLKAEYPAARFQLLGPLDPNPTGVTRAEIDAWVAEGAIEYLGETRDVLPYLAAASVFVLPTWYREGLPRTILEAMATGRAIVTTDAPGCRETVEPGRNGFLVPVRDAPALAGAMAEFLRDPALAAAMGKRSRQIAEARFEVGRVNAILLETMGIAPASSPSRLVAQTAMPARHAAHGVA